LKFGEGPIKKSGVKKSPEKLKAGTKKLVELASKIVSEIVTISGTWTNPNSQTGVAYYDSGIQPM